MTSEVIKKHKFKKGDKVICNSNNNAIVLGYYADNIVEVQLWSKGRYVGITVANESDLREQRGGVRWVAM